MYASIRRTKQAYKQAEWTAGRHRVKKCLRPGQNQAQVENTERYHLFALTLHDVCQPLSEVPARRRVALTPHEGVNWPQHWIASSDQHPIGTGTP